MNKSYKVVVGVIASLGLGFAVTAAYAHPGPMGGGMGPGMMGSMGPRAMGPGFAGPVAGQHLMTPEEHTATINKMRNAATPDERQKIAEATHAEMQKRAKEKGITLPESRGPRAGFGPNFGPAPKAPDTTEHVH